MNRDRGAVQKVGGLSSNRKVQEFLNAKPIGVQKNALSSKSDLSVHA